MAVAVVGVVLIARIDTHDGRCESMYLRYGLETTTCPSGTIRQTARLQIYDVRRGAPASIRIGAQAHFTIANADDVQTMDVPAIQSVTLALIDAKDVATPIAPIAGWKDGIASIKLPELPDGDYKLRAKYTTRLGTGELDIAIPLYTPARVHVITDRPLYEPGNVVRFRAVVLRARDLAPLDGRPGRWMVKDPNGEVLLEEKAPATDWGVVAGTFPLDKLAQTGSWTVAWVSANAVDEVPFTVEPFKLPRFRVDATPDKPFYGTGDKPTIRGAVVYSSGAPVANAKIEIAWSVSGNWPPPLEWEDKLFPKVAKTGANGRFELALPQIPTDLQGRATISAAISAVDPAGDRVEGSAAVLLSKDGIEVSSVTELGDGLVEGSNNRMYVRVATPDGQVVRKTKVTIKRAWQPNDPGITTELDEDGVASLQLDPGAPVNIVIPALPFRAKKKVALVTRDEAAELVGDEGASLADQIEMDKWLPGIGACAKWVGATSVDGEGDGNTSDGSDGGVQIGMRVEPSGAIATVGASPGPLGQCVASVVRAKRLPAGAERLFMVTFRLGDPELSKLATTVISALDVPDGFEEGVRNLARSTRDCLPQAIEGALPRAMTWRVRSGSKEVELGTWITDPAGGEAAATMAIGCVQQRFGTRVKLQAPATSDSLGFIRFGLSPPESVTQDRPQATTMLGYELLVSAAIDGAKVPPSTTMRVGPGSIPRLRMRVSPILANQGDTITAELIRGPQFGTGTLPKELVLRHLKGEQKAVLDSDRKAAFTISKGTEGWVEVSGAGVRALVYVKPETDLAVSVEAKQPRYRPGDQAELQIQTRIGGKGAQAAVGLFGVDESLGQLVTLAAPDSMGRLRPKVETPTPAFGTLDGQALTLGRIRGPNAAAATVLRVSAIPTPPELDAVVNATATSQFDPIEELTDNFYTVLAELHIQTRRWEATAPAAEKMRPATMSQLWTKALAACEQRGEKIVDAYGRKLRLAMLPGDLLALTDPRAVIVRGTRLPEDVENWAAWVNKENP
ncbi:MAG: hypothetical protein H0T42_11100 [Deltaproteobacteria bacterium]|nr:hypothetical protein [Deltaproteobacteria bacterium]